MAIEINGKVYRNLTEQVAQNQADIKELQGSILNRTEIYECERDIDYNRFNNEIPDMVGMSRYYNGKILDIQSVILTGYINSPNGSQLITHDITRQLQSVPDGQTKAFKVGGVLTDIRDDNVELYHFIVNIRVDGTQFYINTARCITGASFQGAQMTSGSTLTNVKVRSILALPITVI